MVLVGQIWLLRLDVDTYALARTCEMYLNKKIKKSNNHPYIKHQQPQFKVPKKLTDYFYVPCKWPVIVKRLT